MILAGWNWTFRSTTYNVVCVCVCERLPRIGAFCQLDGPLRQALHLRLGPCKWLHHRGSELNLMLQVEGNLHGIMNLGEFAGCFFFPFYSEQVWDLALHRNISRVFFPLLQFLLDLLLRPPMMGPAGGPPPGAGSLPVLPRYLMISHHPSHFCSTSRNFRHRKRIMHQ